MKKIIALLALVMAGSSFASEGVNFEFERERSNTGSHSYENTVKVAPFYKMDNGVKFDLQFGASRTDGETNGNNNPLENSIEARVQKMWEIYPSLKMGARVSLGEKFNGENKAGNITDFSYYTVEPKMSYGLTQDLSLAAAYRFRNSFSDSVAYKTRTTKLGADYALTKKDEVGFRYFMKRGDSNTNGLELAYTRSF